MEVTRVVDVVVGILIGASTAWAFVLWWLWSNHKTAPSVELEPSWEGSNVWDAEFKVVLTEEEVPIWEERVPLPNERLVNPVLIEEDNETDDSKNNPAL